MQLSEYLGNLSGFVSITGGGGKTSLLSLIGKRKERVLLTTTTRVLSPRLHDYGQDRIFGDESALGYRPAEGETVFYAEHSTMDMKKWLSPRPEVLASLMRFYDIVAAEADGSRGLPLKVHTDRDPVINAETGTTIAVMGLWGIGERIAEAVFGDGSDGRVDADYLQWYITDPKALTKGMQGRKIIIFNGADSFPWDAMKGLRYPDGVKAVAASIREDKVYEEII